MRKSWFSTGLLLVVFAAFFGTAVGASMSLTNLLAREAQRTQALRAQTDLQHLLTLLVDVETGQRGFMITGQREFLEPYETAVADLTRLRDELKKSLLQAGSNELLLTQLETSIRARLEMVARNIERRTKDGEAVLRDLSSYGEGKRVMDQLRRDVEQLQFEQQLRLTAMDEASEAASWRARQLTQLLPAVGMILLLLALTLMHTDRQQRDRAEAALHDANVNLESQVKERTEALNGALTRIQSFAVEMDRGVEEERRRLAREVHDQVGQVGTSIKMLTVSLRNKLKPQVEPLVDELLSMADEAIRSARHISAALRPPLLDELGLEAALGHHLTTMERQTGLTTRLSLAEADQLAKDQANPLFRIVQEACTNVLRHAAAGSLHVKGRPLELSGVRGYELEVIDDGRGPGSTRVDASGLRNMRERASLAGGVFEFGAAATSGTRVRIWLPLNGPQPSQGLVKHKAEAQA